jgi:hypothetical protein
MGMFDQITPLSEKEGYTEGDVFNLEAARIGPEIDTDYGPGRPVQLKIEGKWYSIFGMGITGQVERMERGDLPARVRIERVATKKAGNDPVKLLVPEGQPTPGENDIPF